MNATYNYQSLGLKAGLEIHQELELSTKLFCRCPPTLQKGEPQYFIKRFFRPVMGEMGEFDKAMLLEYSKNKTIIYEGYFDSSCTYDIDETPPFEINQEAIDLGLTIVLLLNGVVIDELHVCRKNYLDGSVPCGFQRTLIVGLNGELPLKNKKVGINTISIEEDAARKTRTKGRTIYYRVDRLGIPLIELVTDPVLKSPEEIYEAAYRIGLLLRSTGKAKRGIGTVRQDINLSIRDGSRVELKGVQKLDWIKRLVDHEIERQLNLLSIRDELRKRGGSPENLLNKPISLNDVFKETKCKLIKSNLLKGGILLGVRLQNFKGLLGKKIQLDKSFGYEIAERVIVLTGLKGIIHSDENLSKYNISETEQNKIINLLHCSGNDAFAMVIGEEQKALEAINIIVERCKMAYNGVPLETRRALEDGKSKFEREIHGGARLYPDTDLPPIEITQKRISKIKANLPSFPWELEKQYSEKYNLPEKVIRSLILEDKLDLFLKIVNELKIDPVLVSTTFIEVFKALRREGFDLTVVSDGKIYQVFSAIKNGKIAKEALTDVLKEIAKEPKITVEKIIENLGLVQITEEELSKLIDKLIEKNKDMIIEKGDRAFPPLMGDIMKQVRGRIDGKIVSEKLKQKLRDFEVS
ncbi:MAG: Glu-tRNA(Gln) amidotransferase subunit GatE [Candidatus Odinarchaeia archaeon]